MARPSAVLLDFYGTMARAMSRGPLASELFGRRGLAFDQELWDSHRWDALDGLDHQQFSGTREDYEAWEVDRLRRAAEACGVGLDEAEELVAELYAASKDFTVSAYEEVPAVLEELRRRGLVLGVCSNWDWDLTQAVDEAGLADLVDVQVSSAWAGARKPHPRIFEHTLTKLGVEPAACVFVGDTWGPDVAGPRAMGMTPLYLFRDGHWPDPTAPADLDAEGTVVISDLRGVLEHV